MSDMLAAMTAWEAAHTSFFRLLPAVQTKSRLVAQRPRVDCMRSAVDGKLECEKCFGYDCTMTGWLQPTSNHYARD